MKSLGLSALLAWGVLHAASTPAEYQISGPYTHDNLTVFLIHASSDRRVSPYMTLKDAMETNQVMVYETKNVNSLAIENVSNQAVFIQGGDIVKGGQQDRVITNDFVLPPNSGRLPISAFCVEQGRWTQGGDEPMKTFNASPAMIPSNALKHAVIVEGNQQEVWKEVSKEQMGLASGVRKFDRTDGTHLSSTAEMVEVQAARSPSSLMLSMASRPVADATKPYIKALHSILAKEKNVVGYAVAINGEIRGADVYSTSALFASLWPKLLQSSAVEAVRLNGQERPTAQIDYTASITSMLKASESSPQSTVDVDKKVKLAKWETPGAVAIESRDGESWVHGSYLKK